MGINIHSVKDNFGSGRRQLVTGAELDPRSEAKAIFGPLNVVIIEPPEIPPPRLEYIKPRNRTTTDELLAEIRRAYQEPSSSKKSRFAKVLQAFAHLKTRFLQRIGL